MDEIDCMNFPYHQSSKPHCQKCGRRNRNDNSYKNNRRINFPTELPPYPINDNHFISKNIRNRNSSRKSNKKPVFVDQLLQIQPLHTLKRVQQMIYLRENINNLTYREVHFSNEYIILKRLEEKNNFINQNRFKVDHYFCSLKLQYQTISTLSQNITITSFNYSKQDSYQSNLIVKNTVTEMNDTITNESSLNQNGISTITDPIDSPVFITSYNEYKHQQYSQNANQSYRNIDHLTKTKKQNLTLDTTVIVDVRKCSELTTHRLPIHDNWNHVKPTYCRHLPENNQPIYFDQYSRFMDIQQPQMMLFPWSQNSNSTHQTNESLSNISNQTTWFPPNIKKSTEYQLSTPDHQSSTRNTTDISSSIYQTSESQNSFTNSNITSTNTIKKKTLNKIKQILNTLQKKLVNKYHLSTFKSNQIDTTMTSDSLVTTYSISPILPNIIPLSYNKSTINVEKDILQMELDSLNNNYYSNKTKSRIKILNSAKNINSNHQTSEDDDEANMILISTQSQSMKSMSPSFMFVLQILLVICFINRILLYYIFGIMPTDNLVSIIVDNSH